MEVKHLIGIEEGDAVAAFVSRIEEKTGKSLRTVHVRCVAEERVREVLGNSVYVTLDFFPDQPPPPPPNLTT